MTSPAGNRPHPLPSKDDILRFIEEQNGDVSRRDIARAFNIKGDDRRELRGLLRDMAAEGLIDRGRKKKHRRTGAMPSVTVVEITGTDVDGDVLARPVKWEEDSAPPKILMAPERRGRHALGVGERALVRLQRIDSGLYEARVLKRLEASKDKVVGLLRKTAGGYRLVPTDKRERYEFEVGREDLGDAQEGDLVLAEQTGSGRGRLGLKQVRVREKIGRADAPNAFSLISIVEHGIPMDFPADALKEVKALAEPKLDKRTDLRHVDFLTIDPVDARDMDDAIWAAPNDDNGSTGGWRVMVAIADVAALVRPGTALDKAAYERGNSTYFPDRVVPMLPHELSGNLCSLRPNEDRAAMVVEMIFDAVGNKTRHIFYRAIIRSRGKLTYEQVQKAADGFPDADTQPWLTQIDHLYGAYRTLEKARMERQPLDLDLPEEVVELDDEGKVVRIGIRPRYDSHRIVEDFMIAANVCAAEELERHKTPCMYRIHDEPAPEKLANLAEFLQTLGYKIGQKGGMQPRQFNDILRRAQDTPYDQMVNMVVLRSQSQAVYSPHNVGHFGLALQRYAHFTSPIRRYSDLLVHRGLIRALKLGSDGLDDETSTRFEEIGEHISNTERRSMAAERDATDRYVAAYMQDRVGAEFDARITGVTRFGLFVTLPGLGAEGLLPMRALNDDYYQLDEVHHALVGERLGTAYQLGDSLRVKLVEVAPLTGGLRFELTEDTTGLRKVLTASRKPSGRKPSGGKNTGRPQRRNRRG